MPLLHRTTRSVAPTAAGEKLLARLAPTLRELDAAVAETISNRADGKPAGRVRISTSKAASETVIAPPLASFISTYPDVVLELVSDDRGGQNLSRGQRISGDSPAGNARLSLAGIRGAPVKAHVSLLREPDRGADASLEDGVGLGAVWGRACKLQRPGEKSQEGRRVCTAHPLAPL